MADHSDLDAMLAEVLADEPVHTKRILKAAAIVEEAIRREGLEATLVGGGAIEIYAPGAYTTTDLDFVVIPRWDVQFDEAIRSAMTGLGFSPVHRHWVRQELFVEIPSTELLDPVVELPVGPLTLRIIRKESVLAYRIVGYKQWKFTDYAAQAIALIRAFGEDFDDELLLSHLRREDSEDAYRFLRSLAFSDQPITESVLRNWLDNVDLE